MIMKENQQDTNVSPVSDLLPESRPSLLDSLAHSAIQRAVQAISPIHKGGDEPLCLLDATAGNGHDTCFLAGLGASVQKAGQQRISVLACDIQEEALQRTRERLARFNLPAELVLCGHEHIAEYLPEKSVLAGVLFNLGYLPRKDRTKDLIATKAETSVLALEKLCARLYPQGVISVHCYTGHTGGMEEYQAVHDFIAALAPKSWRVLCVSNMNREHNLEYLFLLEKLQLKQKKSV